jgi:hypothetical protein
VHAGGHSGNQSRRDTGSHGTRSLNIGRWRRWARHADATKMNFLSSGRRRWPLPFGRQRTWCLPPGARTSGLVELP